MPRPRTRLRTTLAQALLVIGALASSARAQSSFTSSSAYPIDSLSAADWSVLGRSFFAQSVRGSLALVFPNRPPITEPREVRRWILERPLTGFVFPGLSSDPAGTWAFAKQLAVANHKTGSVERPVVAVNSGWTDLGAAAGHFYELSTLRPAVEAGRVDASEVISRQVADLIRERIDRQRASAGPSEPLLIGCHSAGGYYGANLANLLAARGGQYTAPLRVYNLGIAVPLPRTVRAAQVVGTTDSLALANSPNAGLAARSTRVAKKLSHWGGSEWSLGDSFSARRWQVRSLEQVFGAGGGSDRPRLGPTTVAELRSAAERTSAAASSATLAAKELEGAAGARRILRLKLEHDARLLGLTARRQVALADLLSARVARDPAALRDARTLLRTLRAERTELARSFGRAIASVPRDTSLDMMAFFGNLAAETALSLQPARAFEKAAQGTAATLRLGMQWSKIWLNNPFLNPLAWQPTRRRQVDSPRR